MNVSYSPILSVMALRCYKCEGTEDDCAKSVLQGNKDKYLITCPFGADKCFRSFLKKDSETHVLNSCTNQLGCDWAQDVCDKYADDITCKIGCCDEDECNVGSHVSFNVILLTACSALGLALLMMWESRGPSFYAVWCIHSLVVSDSCICILELRI